MGLFDKIFKKQEKQEVAPKGYYPLTVKELIRLTDDSIQLSFDVNSAPNDTFTYVPGQYVSIAVSINGKEERRSYSICSGPNEPLAIAIKRVENGVVSTWANSTVTVGDTIFVAPPQGNFTWEKSKGFVVAFAAGSGITPMLSIAKHLEQNVGEMRLYYGNKTRSSTMFLNELARLKNTKTNFAFSQESIDGAVRGRWSKDAVSTLIKENLTLLKADAFYVCGPEQLIKDVTDLLTLFGVTKSKIHFELFTTPVLLQQAINEKSVEFEGDSKVRVILDDENIQLTLNSKGMSVLDALNKEGYDPPYSCKGGVCCACKAKVMEGKATMTMNFSLTDEEVAEGFVLTCQCHPASEELVLSYDA
jgi:ring-1,2-phenylacetyl-CoA epoxidase subunit PaaE